jgi:hypothetical protein
MNDPDQMHRVTEERITKLEMEREQLGKNKEAAKMLAEH